MKKCILFASHIPSENKLFVGKESLDKFVESFSDYDIYIGINNSCVEWIDTVKEYSNKLSIIYEITPKNLLDTGGGAAYQTALRLLKNSGVKYDIYWFGHTKGATSNCHNFRKEVFGLFWDQKEKIEYEIFENGYSLYSPYIGVTGQNYLNTTIPVFIKGEPNDDLCSFYSFWVHSGEVVNEFIDRCIPEFFNTNLLSFKRIGGNDGIDRYFFERDFPMIYQTVSKTPKLLYNTISTEKTPYLINILNNINNTKIDF